MGIIVKPIISEKMTDITDKMPNRYAFRVSLTANKIEIANAIEKMYNVKVVSVNTMRYDGKRSSRYTRGGLIKGSKPAFKKAVVTLKEDQIIDFFGNI
ncbi:50S ribosomal protein L23 [Falsiporphyromonas endometrii]|uniref:Large ribosomal subunit protein uL23 n=1 Tax=Falsiporphyromonas endometrii TaxID=1387297 RepID=A0ABV9K4Q6_9PORP|nr:50S ribosomal protein L23 [Porphyromonadaceae bacterium]